MGLPSWPLVQLGLGAPFLHGSLSPSVFSQILPALWIFSGNLCIPALLSAHLAWPPWGEGGSWDPDHSAFLVLSRPALLCTQSDSLDGLLSVFWSHLSHWLRSLVSLSPLCPNTFQAPLPRLSSSPPGTGPARPPASSAAHDWKLLSTHSMSGGEWLSLRAGLRGHQFWTSDSHGYQFCWAAGPE